MLTEIILDLLTLESISRGLFSMLRQSLSIKESNVSISTYSAVTPRDRACSSTSATPASDAIPLMPVQNSP
jgi:hypothetical protein